MPGARRKRKILLCLSLVFLGLVVVVAALPLWFRWALRPIAQGYGARYTTYERKGYQRFVLTEVTFTNQATKFQARRVEALIPTVWLWDRYLGGKTGKTALLAVDNWELEISKSQGPSASVYANVQKFKAGAATLHDWVPMTVLSNGTVRVGNTALKISEATWDHGKLSARVAFQNYGQSGEVTAEFGQRQPHEVFLNSDSLHLRSTFRISEDASGLKVQGTGFWRSNRVDTSAHFNRTGRMPDTASLNSESFIIPAELLKLRAYQDVKGVLAIRWSQNQFAVDLSATGSPLQKETNLPPIQILLHAKGDAESAEIETARISTPWLMAELSEGVRLNFTGPLLSNRATVKVALDLDRQPWFDARGQLNGRAEFNPGPGKYPVSAFTLSGVGLEGFEARVQTFEIEGRFAWPWLEISKTKVEFADGSTASLAGEFDMEKKLIRDGQAQFSGAFGRQWLPPDYSYEEVSLSAEFGGPLQKIVHSGELKIKGFTGPRFHPLQANANWRGEHMSLQNAEITLAAGKSSLEFRGAMEAARTQASLTVQELTLKKNSEPALELEKPAQLWWKKNAIGLDRFHWVGKGREVKLDGNVRWPQSGSVTGLVQALPLSLFEDFFKMPPENVALEELKFSADWDNGPATSAVTASISTSPKEGASFVANLNLRGDRKGISLERLAVSSQSESVVMAQGFLPLTITPGDPKDLVKFLPEKPLELKATTQPQSIFWNQVAAWTGVELQQPSLNVDVTGTWQSAQGQIELKAQRIKLPEWKRKLPALENLQVVVDLDEQTARVKSFTLLVEGQPVTLTGEIPLGRDFWTSLAKKPRLPDWRAASARLKIGQVQIAPIAGLMPSVLSPEGTLNLDLGFLPGGKLDGELAIAGARTRPWQTFGSVRDIQVKVRFIEHDIKLETATAVLGGEAVSATGGIRLPEKWRADALPPFQMSLRGSNVPLARMPELILRGDVNLTISNSAAATPIIFGDVRLRDSFYLRDLKDLIPGTVATPRRRPPYFSIDHEAFANWRLRVQISGAKFLKVRSPLFRGEVSTNVRLQGSLKDPIVLGDLKIDSGTVRFPFGNLQVDQGFVSLTSENPYRPQLFVTASSRRLGYDMKLEVHGPVDDVIVEFSSVPPLTSEQIVLMLTAGELPKSETSLSTQQRAGRLAFFLGKDLLTKFGLGDGETEERLTIRAGEDVSEDGKATYALEYKLSDNWWLVGEYDRFNQFNAGFKWRVYSK